MLVVDLNEMLLWLNETPGCGKPTLAKVQKETKIGKNVLYALAKKPTGMVKMADLDKLLNFFFKRLAQAKVFVGPPERVAADVLSRLVKWYPNDKDVLRGVHQSMEIRDVFSKFTPMLKDIVLSDAFWVEYRRVHKGIPSMTRKPKRILIAGKSKPFAVIKAKPSTLHRTKGHRISKPTQKRP